MRTHLLKSMASGPLKIEKGTRPVLILATHCHTTESVWRQPTLKKPNFVRVRAGHQECHVIFFYWRARQWDERPSLPGSPHVYLYGSVWEPNGSELK